MDERTPPSMAEFRILCSLKNDSDVSVADIAGRTQKEHGIYEHLKRPERKGYVVGTTNKRLRALRRTAAGDEYVKRITLCALPNSLNDCPWFLKRR